MRSEVCEICEDQEDGQILCTAILCTSLSPRVRWWNRLKPTIIRLPWLQFIDRSALFIPWRIARRNPFLQLQNLPSTVSSKLFQSVPLPDRQASAVSISVHVPVWFLSHLRSRRKRFASILEIGSLHIVSYCLPFRQPFFSSLKCLFFILMVLYCKRIMLVGRLRPVVNVLNDMLQACGLWKQEENWQGANNKK